MGTSDTWLDLVKANCKGIVCVCLCVRVYVCVCVFVCMCVCVFEANISVLPLRIKWCGFVMKIINFASFIKADNLLTNCQFFKKDLFLQMLPQTDRQTDRHEISVPLIARNINVYNLFLACGKPEQRTESFIHFSTELSCVQKNWIEVGHLSAAYFPENLFPTFPS